MSILEIYEDITGETPHHKTKNEYSGPCPLCGGEDRFIMWVEEDSAEDRFWCRQCNIKGHASRLYGITECDTSVPVSHFKRPRPTPYPQKNYWTSEV